MTDLEFLAAKEESTLKTKIVCKHWLRDMGFWRDGQTISGLMKELAAYRESLLVTPKPEGTEWARILLSKALDGKPVVPIALVFAKQAIASKSRKLPLVNKSAYAGD